MIDITLAKAKCNAATAGGSSSCGSFLEAVVTLGVATAVTRGVATADSGVASTWPANMAAAAGTKTLSDTEVCGDEGNT